VAKLDITFARLFKGRKVVSPKGVQLNAWRGQITVQKARRRGVSKQSPLQRAWVDWFKSAARASKSAYPEQRDNLISQAKGTQWYWRDIIERAMAGKLFAYEGQWRVSVPTVSVLRASEQSIPVSAYTQLTFPTTSWDTNEFRVAGNDLKLVVKTPGLYRLDIYVRWGTTGSTGFRAVKIAITDDNTLFEDQRTAISGGNVSHVLGGLMYLTAGQEITAWAFSNQASQTCRIKRLSVVGMTPEAVL